MKVCLKKFVLLCLFFFPNPFHSEGQVLNIEDPSTSLDSLRKNDFRYGIGLNGNLSRQSKLVYDYGLISEIVYHRNDRYQLLLNAKYLNNGTSDGVLINSGYYYFRFTPGFQKRFAPQFFIQQQMDEGRGLVFRNLFGMNLRFDALKYNHFCMQVSGGIMQEDESWNRSGSPDLGLQGRTRRSRVKSNNVVRLTADLGKHIELSFINFLQMPLEKKDFSFRWSSQLNLSIKFNSWFSLQLNYQSMFDTNPVIDIPDYYYTTSSGIGFTRE